VCLSPTLNIFLFSTGGEWRRCFLASECGSHTALTHHQLRLNGLELGEGSARYFTS